MHTLSFVWPIYLLVSIWYLTIGKADEARKCLKEIEFDKSSLGTLPSFNPLPNFHKSKDIFNNDNNIIQTAIYLTLLPLGWIKITALRAPSIYDSSWWITGHQPPLYAETLQAERATFTNMFIKIHYYAQVIATALISVLIASLGNMQYYY